VIVKLFNKGIIENHAIPAINPFLLSSKMKFVNTTYLMPKKLFLSDMSELLISIENNVRLAIIPLKSYCKEFIVYLTLFNINVQSYVEYV
jgi:hypothetical protein